jgi:hypothetical protein
MIRGLVPGQAAVAFGDLGRAGETVMTVVLVVVPSRARERGNEKQSEKESWGERRRTFFENVSLEGGYQW